MIYLYAITDTRPPALSSSGIEGAEVDSTACAGLHAIWSQHSDDAEFTPAPAALWAHETVVDELLATNAILPLRFGTTLPDLDAVRDLLQRERERFGALLDRVRGHVELAVRVALPEHEAETPGNGAGYLTARVASRREREAAAHLVLAPLDRLATASSHRPDNATLLRASYLVRPSEVERFAAALRQLQDANPQLTVSCTGPWAPYSFVVEDRPS